jgi:hypothetical protein
MISAVSAFSGEAAAVVALDGDRRATTQQAPDGGNEAERPERSR